MSTVTVVVLSCKHFCPWFRISFNMTAEVVVRGELEIHKGIDGINLDEALMMLDSTLMQVCCV